VDTPGGVTNATEAYNGIAWTSKTSMNRAKYTLAVVEHKQLR
jgi:hypothetical protein